MSSGEFDFILDGIRYSFSSVSSYDTCNYAFYLTYIESKDRKSNIYAENGLLVHKTLEEFFLKKLEYYELSDYFKNNYSNFIKSEIPFYMKNKNAFYEDGLNFFDSFHFDIDDYDIISVEETINYEWRDVKIIVKPDLILYNKITKEYELWDYKTSTLKEDKAGKEKVLSYLKQMNLYVQFYWWSKNIPISKIKLWFTKYNDIKTFTVSPVTAINVTEEWFMKTISEIKNDSQWKPNTKNKFFCNNLCSVNDFCKYKEI